MAQFERVAGVATIVGESPIWDEHAQALWFVDREGHSVHRLRSDDSLDSWSIPEPPAAIAPTTDGRLAITHIDGFRMLDPETGDIGPSLSGGVSAAERISEGKPDRQGRIHAASGDRGFREPVGHLLRLEPDGSTTVLLDGIHRANGLCFSVDGETLYLADSLTRLVHAYDYDERGLSNERVVFSAAGEVHFPDGATVDSEGCLWIALLHVPYVVRIAPDGTEVGRLELPTPNVTSLAFGGPDLDVLYLTSVSPSRFPKAPPGAPQFPGAEEGHLYRVTGLGVRGVAEVPVAPWVTAE